MASSLLGLFDFKAELNQIRESEPMWTCVDVIASDVWQSQSQASGLCDSQWRRIKERWQAPVRRLKRILQNWFSYWLTYRAFRAATADQRYLKASTAQLSEDYRRLCRILLDVRHCTTYSRSTSKIVHNFLLDRFFCSYQWIQRPTLRLMVCWIGQPTPRLKRLRIENGFQFQKFHFYLGEDFWIETTIHFQMGHDFFHFAALNFWYASSLQEIEPYATRCGENPLDWSMNNRIVFLHVSIHILDTELNAISFFLSFSLSFFFSIKRRIEGTCRHSKELSYWCIPESVEAGFCDH